MIRSGLLSLAVCTLPLSATAIELPAGSSRAAEDFSAYASYRVPVTPWSTDGFETVEAEGRIIREAWHIAGQVSTLELTSPLRNQLLDEGYEVLLECETDACGGFDFRFEIDVIPEPSMHVDLGDFRFISAKKNGENGTSYITLMISKSAHIGYVQFVKVLPASIPLAEQENLATKTPNVTLGNGDIAGSLVATSNIATHLEQSGRAILAGLSFETGSSQLSDQEFPALAELAAFLKANPNRKVTLVGHTDASGSLEANINISRARARAVKDRLVSVHSIPAAQLGAEGIGYLMPLSSNLTEEGRAANRRVEVVLTSTE